MKLRTLACCLTGTLLLSACEPKAPEAPTKPPAPSAASAAAPSAEEHERPTLQSRFDSAGRRTQYAAYFEGPQLARIEETPDGGGPTAKYTYRGARLLKYSQPGNSGEVILELDDRGRVQRALVGQQTLAQTEIDAIRTRAQLLRSHALAKQATKMHGS